MTDDLVKRLRELEQWMREPEAKSLTLTSDLFDEAADRIEELKAELAEERRSREEAQSFAWRFSYALKEITAMTPDPEFGTLPIEAAIKVARAALGEKKDG